MKRRASMLGVTLFELILVAGVTSIIILAGIRYTAFKMHQIRIDKMTLQMQQILNAGLSYYTAQGAAGKWPASSVAGESGIDCLRAVGATATTGTACTVPYLPPNLVLSPWGNPYYTPNTANSSTMPLFSVWTPIQSGAVGNAKGVAEVIAGTLPLAYTTGAVPVDATTPPAAGTVCSTASGSTCYVVAMVNIPGQNLNAVVSNSADGAVKFGGLYHHGACVPVPACPAGTTAQIFLTPVSVSGVYDAATDPRNLYSINSFTAYAQAAKALPDECSSTASAPVPGTTPCKAAGDPADPASAMASPPKYWRACMQIITEGGPVPRATPAAGNEWGKYATMMAITRCAVSSGTGEATGSSFQVYSN
jgi:hypothetical protein